MDEQSARSIYQQKIDQHAQTDRIEQLENSLQDILYLAIGAIEEKISVDELTATLALYVKNALAEPEEQ